MTVADLAAQHAAGDLPGCNGQVDSRLTWLRLLGCPRRLVLLQFAEPRIVFSVAVMILGYSFPMEFPVDFVDAPDFVTN